MIRESAADIIRRKRGMPAMDAAAELTRENGETMDGMGNPFAAAIGGAMPDPADVEQAAQMLQEQEAQEQPPSIPAQQPPQSTLAPVDNRDQEELNAAQEADRASRFTAGMELAGRQLVGGITRTPVSQGIGAAPSQVPGAMAAAKSRSERAAEALRLKRQGALDEKDDRRYEDERGDKAVGRSEKAAALLLAQREKAKAEAESLRRFNVTDERQKESNAAQLALSRAGLGIRAEGEKRDAEKFEADKVKDAAKKTEDVPPEFEVQSGANPSPETRKKFTALVGSSEKMKKLTGRMREALGGTTGLSRTVDPGTVTKLKQLATMIQIEAKNVAGLGALSGPDMGLMNAIAKDPTSVWTNLTTDLPGMLSGLDSWGDAQVGGESTATGIVRKGKAGGDTKTVGGKTYKKVAGGWDEVK